MAVAVALMVADGVPAGAVARDDPAKRGMVAVFEIEVDGMTLSPAVVANLTAYLSSRMTAVGGYKTVASNRIERALVEKKRESHADACDKTCQIELAQKVSADKVLHAKIWRVGSACSVMLDLYDLESEVMEESVEVEASSCTEPKLKKAVADAALSLGGGRTTLYVEPAIDVASPAISGAGAAVESGVEWIRIPGGTFQMGSKNGDSDEKPVHAVTVRTFEIAETETTVAQYRKCVEAGVCTLPHWDDGTCNVWNGSSWNQGVLPQSFRGERQPVVCIDWNQAVAYANWVGGRLPTEAEWEYAARGGGRDKNYPWGNQQATCSYAVMNDGSGNGCGHGATWPVCSKRAGNTSQGLCDMSGNVWEWVQDWYHPSYAGAPSNGAEWENSGLKRVIRGGSWGPYAGYVRAANRNHYEPGERGSNVGVRPARTLH